MRLLWTKETVDFKGRWDTVEGAGVNPLPVQRPIPIWIGASGVRCRAYADESAVRPTAGSRSVRRKNIRP